jgi:hypothetical protein
MRNWYGLAGWCCLALAPQLAMGAVLGSVSFSEVYTRPSTTVPGLASSAVTVRFGYSLTPGDLEDLGTSIFDTLLLDETAGLQTFTLASTVDDPEFAAFIGRATNGFDDDLRAVAIGNEGGGGGKVGPESGMLIKTYNSAAPDLAGSTITALALYIAEIIINPLATMGQVNWLVSGELRFLGEAPDTTPVPLPPTWGLLALALVTARRSRRGQRKHP